MPTILLAFIEHEEFVGEDTQKTVQGYRNAIYWIVALWSTRCHLINFIAEFWLQAPASQFRTKCEPSMNSRPAIQKICVLRYGFREISNQARKGGIL